MALLTQTVPHVCFIDVKSRDDAISLLIKELDVDHKRVYQSVIQREKVVSTGIGFGIAIPHAKLPEIDEFQVVIGIVKHEGIQWGAIDQLPVKLIMLICGPDDRHKEYLTLLSDLTKKIKNENVRQSLFLCKSREEVVKIFQAW